MQQGNTPKKVYATWRRLQLRRAKLKSLQSRLFRAPGQFWLLKFASAGPGARHDVNGAAELPRCSMCLFMTLTFLHLLKFWWGTRPMSSYLSVQHHEPTGGPVRRTEIHKRKLPILILFFFFYILFFNFIFCFHFSGSCFAAKSVLCRFTGSEPHQSKNRKRKD